MKINSNTAELVGIIIGDGYIHFAEHRYFGFTGSPKTDKEYYRFLSNLIFKVCKKKIKVKERYRGLRIVVYSKDMVNFLVRDLGMSYGENKSLRITIPEIIANDWNLARYAIRGIVDTDGSVFVSDKPGYPQYPSIEITTSSRPLALQIRDILLKRGFRVAKIWSYKSKLSTLITYKIPLNGKTNLEKWIKEIGFSNPYKMKRAIEACS
jgi:intein/homing endonuclease